MKILVTGANGYLGQGVVKALLDNGHSVVAADFKTNYVDGSEDFKSYQNLTSLNRRVLVELVESITVYDKEHIHIQYRFDQEIRNVLEYCSSVPAAETEESAV